METPGLPLYDKYCIELTEMALKNAKERAKRRTRLPPRLEKIFSCPAVGATRLFVLVLFSFLFEIFI